MAINRSIISAQDLLEVTDVAITMLTERPVANLALTQQAIPNVLLGYYDSVNDKVELYVRDASGYRVIPIV